MNKKPLLKEELKDLHAGLCVLTVPEMALERPGRGRGSPNKAERSPKIDDVVSGDNNFGLSCN